MPVVYTNSDYYTNAITTHYKGMYGDSVSSTCPTINTILNNQTTTSATSDYSIKISGSTVYSTDADINTYNPIILDLVGTPILAGSSATWDIDYTTNSITYKLPMTITNDLYTYSPEGVAYEELLITGYKKYNLRKNLIPVIKSRVNLIQGISEKERVALETLREMITEAEYRKYISHGFVLVKVDSGDIYQIFRVKAHAKVWRNGKVVEEVCVRIKDKEIPPTDNVIAFMTMIQANEQDFKSIGNVYKFAA
jgi:hypothetical protein